MTENEFASLWSLKPRLTPLPVAMTSAMVESSFRENAIGNEASGHTSHGLFQFNSKWYPEAMTWGVAKQMDEYDARMGAAIRSHGTRTAFRKWNGSGPMAEAYADRCMRVLYEHFGTQEELIVDPAVRGAQTTPKVGGFLIVAGTAILAATLWRKGR